MILVEDIQREKTVALKLMKYKVEWEREKMRRQEVGGGSLDEHVLEILDSHIDEAAHSCMDGRPFLIVLPAAQMDLNYFLSHNRVARTDLKAVVKIMRQIGQHVQFMHQSGRIHADLKPRNVVKIEGKWYVWLARACEPRRAHAQTKMHAPKHAGRHAFAGC